MNKINIGIVGIGNCASSLYQGIYYYRETDKFQGIMKSEIGGYNTENIEVVACIDIDKRKVGKTMKDAILSKPNCTPIYMNNIPDGPTVVKGPVLDGVCIPENLKDHEDFFYCK